MILSLHSTSSSLLADSRYFEAMRVCGYGNLRAELYDSARSLFDTFYFVMFFLDMTVDCILSLRPETSRISQNLKSEVWGLGTEQK